MKRILSVAWLLPCTLALLANPVRQLTKRIAPGREKDFQFVLEKGRNSRSYFAVSSNKDRISIKGDSYISIASGLNWYLKYYCGVSYTETVSILALPETLPVPQNRIYKETGFQIGYSIRPEAMPLPHLFRTWEEWEKEIDKMALNGVNVFPAWIATDALWLDFLEQQGISRSEACQALYGTPEPPSEWLKQRKRIQEKVLQRMSSLGIAAVFPAFTGEAPGSLSAVFHISPDDPRFLTVAREWYQLLRREYGSTSFYYGEVSDNGHIPVITEALEKYTPEGKWIFSSTAPGTASGTRPDYDPNQMIYLYKDDNTVSQWLDEETTHQLPWLWTYQKTTGNSSFSEFIRQPELCGNHPQTGGRIMGIGTSLPQIEGNTFIYDVVQELRWQPEILSWQNKIRHYVGYRYGQADSTLVKAWADWAEIPGADRFTPSLATRLPGGSYFNGEDGNQSEEERLTLAEKLQQQLSEVTQAFISRSGTLQNARYQEDLARLGCRLLDIQMDLAYHRFHTAFQQKDRAAMELQQKAFIEALTQYAHLQAFLTRDSAQPDDEWVKRYLVYRWNTEGSIAPQPDMLIHYALPCWNLYFSSCFQRMQGRQVMPPVYSGLADSWCTVSSTVPAPDFNEVLEIVTGISQNISKL